MDDLWIVLFIVGFPFWFYLVVRLAAMGIVKSVIEELLGTLDKLAKKEEERNG